LQRKQEARKYFFEPSQQFAPPCIRLPYPDNHGAARDKRVALREIFVLGDVLGRMACSLKSNSTRPGELRVDNERYHATRSTG
jgi:hypothetical protein